VQEQVHDVLEGEGLMKVDGKNRVLRKHSFVVCRQGRARDRQHGLVDLVFPVITSSVTDDERRA
jgi:mannose-6-phosphate isomerase-like protein (cupin superfamily)